MSNELRIIEILAAEFTSHSLPVVLREMADFVEEHKPFEVWDTTIQFEKGRYVGVVYYVEVEE